MVAPSSESRRCSSLFRQGPGTLWPCASAAPYNFVSHPSVGRSSSDSQSRLEILAATRVAGTLLEHRFSESPCSGLPVLANAICGSATLPSSGVVEVNMNTSNKLRFIAAAIAAALVCAPAPAMARDSNSKEASSDFGIGVVAALANLVYMPVKVTYGIMGGVTGGFAYVLSGANREVAEGVWVPSMGGDYVLTTDHMTGREQVHFNGVREENAFQSASSDDDTLGEGSGGGF